MPAKSTTKATITAELERSMQPQPTIEPTEDYLRSKAAKKYKDWKGGWVFVAFGAFATLALFALVVVLVLVFRPNGAISIGLTIAPLLLTLLTLRMMIQGAHMASHEATQAAIAAADKDTTAGTKAVGRLLGLLVKSARAGTGG